MGYGDVYFQKLQMGYGDVCFYVETSPNRLCKISD